MATKKDRVIIWNIASDGVDMDGKCVLYHQSPSFLWSVATLSHSYASASIRSN